MTDEHNTGTKPQLPSPDHGDPSDTLLVPPPTFRERLLAAQRARASEARSTVDIPLPAQPKIAVPAKTDSDSSEPPSSSG